MDMATRTRAEEQRIADEGTVAALPLDDGAEPLVLAAVPEGEVLEPGRALAVADFAPPALGPGERLIRLAYRLGIPGSTLAAPFAKPAKLRLLATVESPLTGDRAAGVALRAGHFLVHGVKAPIAQMDFAPAARLTPPFERVVHGFAWLRDLAECAPREQGVPTAERVLGAWLAANPKPVKSPAWNVEHVGQRLLAWLVHAPLVLSGANAKLRPRVLAAIDQCVWSASAHSARSPGLHRLVHSSRD